MCAWARRDKSALIRPIAIQDHRIFKQMNISLNIWAQIRSVLNFFCVFFNYLFYLLILFFVSTTGFDGCFVKTSNINGHLSLHWSVWGPNCLTIFVGTTALVKSKLCLQETLVKETCWGTLLNEKLQDKETRRWPVLNHILQVTKGGREGVLK